MSQLVRNPLPESSSPSKDQPKQTTKSPSSPRAFGVELIKPGLASVALDRVIKMREKDLKEVHDYLRRETGIPPDSVLWKIELDKEQCASDLKNYILCSEGSIHPILCEEILHKWGRCMNGL